MKVRFAETPGASYQDTGFAFKIWASAERAVLVKMHICIIEQITLIHL